MSPPRVALAVVGGGPAGLSAARAYREAGGPGEVVIVADEERFPYRRPPLTKQLLRGEMGEEELPLQTPAWAAAHGVRVLATRAVHLDADAHELHLEDGRTLAYAWCVLAAGAAAGRPPIPGVDDPRVHVVRTLQHVRELLGHLHDGDAVVVIGSGFIGCEISSSLRHRGHPVTLVSDEPGPQQTRLGEEVAARLAGWLRADGVELRLGAAVDALCPGPGDGLRVQAGDVDVPATRVVLAGGAVPRLQLARAAGLPIDGGGVVADAAMRTPREDILVAGDIAFAHNRAAGRPLRVEHWGEALAQGEVAGRSAAGQTAAWEAVPGFWSTIGTRTLKQAAWGDGHDAVQLTPHPDGAFTARYVSGGRLVGVLTHDRDQDYERGQDEIARAAQAP